LSDADDSQSQVQRGITPLRFACAVLLRARQFAGVTNAGAHIRGLR
jgi:hypothetical protein